MATRYMFKNVIEILRWLVTHVFRLTVVVLHETANCATQMRESIFGAAQGLHLEERQNDSKLEESKTNGLLPAK